MLILFRLGEIGGRPPDHARGWHVHGSLAVSLRAWRRNGGRAMTRRGLRGVSNSRKYWFRLSPPQGLALASLPLLYTALVRTWRDLGFVRPGQIRYSSRPSRETGTARRQRPRRGGNIHRDFFGADRGRPVREGTRAGRHRFAADGHCHRLFRRQPFYSRGSARGARSSRESQCLRLHLRAPARDRARRNLFGHAAWRSPGFG